MGDVINKQTFQELKSVNSPDYSTESWLHNYDTSHLEGIEKMYWKYEDNAIREMTDDEKFEKNQGDIETYRTNKLNEIDMKTQMLIAEGFEYKGKIFSLSLAAQANWNAMLTFALAGGLQFPYEISAMYRETDKYDILDLPDLQAFIQIAFDKVARMIATGRTLKIKANELTTVPKIQKLTDNRTGESTTVQVQAFIDSIDFEGDSSMQDEV